MAKVKIGALYSTLKSYGSLNLVKCTYSNGSGEIYITHTGPGKNLVPKTAIVASFGKWRASGTQQEVIAYYEADAAFRALRFMYPSEAFLELRNARILAGRAKRAANYKMRSYATTGTSFTPADYLLGVRRRMEVTAMPAVSATTRKKGKHYGDRTVEKVETHNGVKYIYLSGGLSAGLPMVPRTNKHTLYVISGQVFANHAPA
jgi:hypothetical protein